MAESIQAYTQRLMQKFDTNRNGVIELQPTIFSQHVEAGGPNNNMKNRKFFEMARNPIMPWVADSYQISRTVQAAIDTNNDGQVGLMEKIKAYFRFGLW